MSNWLTTTFNQQKRLLRFRALLGALFVVLSCYDTAIGQDWNCSSDPVLKVGQELWSLPIGGELQISNDGKTLLVTSFADSSFYTVDVASGTILRKLSIKYVVNGWKHGVNGAFFDTEYSVDENLTSIFVFGSVFNGADFNGIWDVVKDTLIRQTSDSVSASAISGKLGGIYANLNRWTSNSYPGIYDLKTFELKTHPIL